MQGLFCLWAVAVTALPLRYALSASSQTEKAPASEREGSTRKKRLRERETGRRGDSGYDISVTSSASYQSRSRLTCLSFKKVGRCAIWKCVSVWVFPHLHTHVYAVHAHTHALTKTHAHTHKLIHSPSELSPARPPSLVTQRFLHSELT